MRAVQLIAFDSHKSIYTLTQTPSYRPQLKPCFDHCHLHSSTSSQSLESTELAKATSSIACSSVAARALA